MIDIQTILAVSGGIMTIAGAITVIVNIINKVKEPDRVQDERLSALEKKVEEHEKLLNADNDRLNIVENGNRVTQRAILALLSHGIDGNEVESMKKAKEDLEKFLIDK